MTVISSYSRSWYILAVFLSHHNCNGFKSGRNGQTDMK